MIVIVVRTGVPTVKVAVLLESVPYVFVTVTVKLELLSDCVVGWVV